MPRPKTADVYHPLDAHMAARLARRRQELGLSQSALDRALGFAPGTIGKFERHRRLMTVAQLYRLADALDRPVAWFFEDYAEGGTPSDSAAEVIPASETEAFLEMYGSIKEPSVRREVAALVKAVAAWYGSKPDPHD